MYDHETMCEDRTKKHSVVEAGETIENRKSFWFLSLFFLIRQILLSLLTGKNFFLKFFFGGFGCKMKFGESFVFPDPGSRVSHEPLKMVTSPSSRRHHGVLTFCQKKQEGKIKLVPKSGSIVGRDLLKQDLSIRAGAFGVGLKAACSGAQLGKV